MYATFDIEAKRWIEFLILGFYDGKEYKEFYSPKKFLNYIFNKKKYHNLHLYAHNGGRYDFNFLFDELFSDKYDMKIIDRKGRLLSLVVINKETKIKIQFIDSLSLLPLSLKKLCDTFGIKHSKGTIDFNKLNRVTKKLRDYLKTDCIALYNAINEFDLYMKQIYNHYIEDGEKKYKRKLTIASQSWDYFNKINNERFQQLSEFVEDEFRKNHYSGGRVEVFKGYGENLNYYDINSLYPFAMLQSMPCGHYYHSNKIIRNRIGFYKVKVLNNIEMNIPPFLIKAKKNKGNYYCNAEKNDEVYLSSYDINVLNDLGYRFRCIDGIYFDKKEKVFYDFVTQLYELRKDEVTKGMDKVLKLLLNSLYGKLGSSRYQKELRFQTSDVETVYNAELGIVLVDKIRNSKFILPYLASYITSIARMELYKYLISSEPFYCDTDSIITKKNMKTGKNIGDLKLESKIIKGCFALPKTYSYIDSENKNHSTVKGFSDNFTFNKMYKTLEKNEKLKSKKTEKPLSFREALRRKKDIKHKVNDFLITVETDKETVLKYEKRKIIPDKKYLFKTEPYTIRELENMNII